MLDAAEVSITDILVTFVYMRRARAHLAIETEEWALHRVFLGALVLAHKVSRARVSSYTFLLGSRDADRVSHYLAFKRFDPEERQLVLRHWRFRNEGYREDGEGVPRCLGLRTDRLRG